MIITKTTRIFQIQKEIQEKIIADIRKALESFTDNCMIDEALESRLCDLEDLIDINKYL